MYLEPGHSGTVSFKVTIMGKPRQAKCQVADCDTGWTNLDGDFVEGPYMTDPDCSNVTERQQDLRDHVDMVHNHPNKQIEARAKQVEAEAAKLKAEAEKLRAEAEVSGSNDANGGGPKVKERLIWSVLQWKRMLLSRTEVIF